MIPLRDNNPSRTVPLVNITLIAANLAVFVYQLTLGRRLEGFYYAFGVVPRQFFAGALSLGDAQTYQQGGVAWWAHIGGFAAGLAAGFVVRARDRRRPFAWR